MRKARGNSLSLPLENAPMRCAPVNEHGVVLLFGEFARAHRIKIEQIRSGFPDCIAYQPTADGLRRLRIEFEFRSRNFADHGHDPKDCDWIVCWQHDWPNVPRHIHVIELCRNYGIGFNVWLLHGSPRESFPVERGGCSPAGQAHRQSRPGDLFLYCWSDDWSDNGDGTSHLDYIRHLYVVSGLPKRAKHFACGTQWYAPVRPVCRLKEPLFATDLVHHPVLKSSHMVNVGRENAGYLNPGDAVTTYWHYIKDLIIARNPAVRTRLQKYST